MTTREEALAYGLSFPDTYQEAPFHDENWQLVRVKGCKKAFLWTYERNGYINLNVKVSPEWRDLWRSTYSSVIAGWHQNKEHWNTIILDGTVPDEDIRRMIAESMILYLTVQPRGYMKLSGKFRGDRLQLMDRLRSLQAIRRWRVQLAMHFIRILTHQEFRVTEWLIQRESLPGNSHLEEPENRQSFLWQMELRLLMAGLT